MRRSTKAALLSCFVFPGVGHLYLRQYVRGALLATGAAALIYFIVSVAVNTAYDVAGKIQSGDVQLNVESISDLVSKQSRDSEESTNIATMALIVLWVIGIADSYREGRAQDKAREMSSKGRKDLL